jgi:hypothetical protein
MDQCDVLWDIMMIKFPGDYITTDSMNIDITLKQDGGDTTVPSRLGQITVDTVC